MVAGGEWEANLFRLVPLHTWSQLAVNEVPDNLAAAATPTKSCFIPVMVSQLSLALLVDVAHNYWSMVRFLCSI